MWSGSVERVASGEGGSRAPDTLPIDIQYLKAVDWLVERRVVSSSWQKTLRTAQAKLNDALQADRPPVAGIEEVLPAGRQQEGTTYFECARVVSLLKEAGLGDKNFLGAFTNEHTARWADVVKRYESGSVFLIDTAQYLIHNVAYELPALKKELSRAEKELAELQRRHAEFVAMAEATRVRYTAACGKKQISAGERQQIRTALRSSLAQLRPLYDSVARLAQHPDLLAAREMYIGVTKFAMERAGETGGEEAGGSGKASKGAKSGGKQGAVAAKAPPAAAAALDPDAVLPTLRRLQAIDLAAAAPLAAGAASASAGAVEGDAGGASAATGGIDWGGANDGAAAAAIEVD